MTIYDGYIGGGDSGASRQAASASSDASAAKRDVGEMEKELGRMRLVCAALWELVKEKTGLTEEDLVLKVADIDGRDGVIDGQLTRRMRKCVKCARAVKAKQRKCMYCSTIQPVETMFEAI